MASGPIEKRVDKPIKPTEVSILAVDTVLSKRKNLSSCRLLCTENPAQRRSEHPILTVNRFQLLDAGVC